LLTDAHQKRGLWSYNNEEFRPNAVSLYIDHKCMTYM